MKLNKKLLRNKRGFTLIEVLIVLVILAILAGLAIPIYSSQVSRSYRAEALSNIGQIRSALSYFYSMNGSTYASAGWGTPLSATAIGMLDPGVAGNVGGQTPHFTYSLGTPTSVGYTITAVVTGVSTALNGKTVVFTQSAESGSTLT